MTGTGPHRKQQTRRPVRGHGTTARTPGREEDAKVDDKVRMVTLQVDRDRLLDAVTRVGFVRDFLGGYVGALTRSASPDLLHTMGLGGTVAALALGPAVDYLEEIEEMFPLLPRKTDR